MMLRTVTKMVVANIPADAFLSPSGGGVVGWDTILIANSQDSVVVAQ